MSNFELMKIKILAFGIAKEILNSRELELEVPTGSSIGGIKDLLIDRYPDFSELRSLSLALNEEYASDHDVVEDGDKVVVIPPVSGG